MRKILISTLLCSAVLATSTSFSCSQGQFGIDFHNNTNDTHASTTAYNISVQVQDENGKDLTSTQSVDPGNDTVLCFSEDYTAYKLWQYPGKDSGGKPNSVYTITADTLKNSGYYMHIYATDSNFKSVTTTSTSKGKKPTPAAAKAV